MASRTATSVDDLIRFVYEDEDCIYIDAHEDHDVREMSELLEVLDQTFGLELLSEDESEPEDLGGGWTRIYMACTYEEVGTTWG